LLIAQCFPNYKMLTLIEDALLCDVKTADKPQFTVALGALFVE